MKTAIKAIAAILGLAALAIVGREVAAQLPRFTAWVLSLIHISEPTRPY